MLPRLFGASVVCFVLAQNPTSYGDARSTDPNTLGWMKGTPPPAEKRIQFADGSYFTFPKFRWSFSHWRELVPTVNITRGTGPVTALASVEHQQNAIDRLEFQPSNGGKPLTWAASLEANYTDGIVVLHRGRIVYEKYFGALEAERPHIAFSVTKSFFGTIAAMLIQEGKLDPNARVDRYLPELKNSGFGDATVTQVLDMTSALKYTEVYGQPVSDLADYARALGVSPRPANYQGPASVYEYLAQVAKEGTHGDTFTYRTINTEVLAWLIARVEGAPAQDVLARRIWSRLGAEGDAYLALGGADAPSAGGGFNCRLRDLARFGEMIRRRGQWNGQQIVPAAVIEEFERGGSKEAFAKNPSYRSLAGWTYHQQWWISHQPSGMIAARGIHGQGIYIYPKAEVVIARFASHPMAGNVNIDPTSLPAFEAVANYLSGNRTR